MIRAFRVIIIVVMVMVKISGPAGHQYTCTIQGKEKNKFATLVQGTDSKAHQDMRTEQRHTRIC